MSTAGCTNPLDLAVLLDYWSAELPPADEERVEAHLLGCGRCSERLGGLAELGEGIRALMRQGAVRVVLAPSVLERAARGGLRTREYRVSPGGRVACTVAPDDDLVVARLQFEVAPEGRIDLVLPATGAEEVRLRDVPVSATAREVVLAERVDVLRGLGRSVSRMRLVVVDEHGERLLGEYTFDHTPWTSGPTAPASD